MIADFGGTLGLRGHSSFLAIQRAALMLPGGRIEPRHLSSAPLIAPWACCTTPADRALLCLFDMTLCLHQASTTQPCGTMPPSSSKVHGGVFWPGNSSANSPTRDPFLKPSRRPPQQPLLPTTRVSCRRKSSTAPATPTVHRTHTPHTHTTHLYTRALLLMIMIRQHAVVLGSGPMLVVGVPRDITMASPFSD